MSASRPPTAVLSEALRAAIRGRTVRVAVFTTFSFDPAFFEEQILPDLFDQAFHQPRKIRLIQLEEAFQQIDAAAVYYDRRALSQEALPARLDVRRLDVSRRTGCFHPKVILLLVDEDEDVEEGEVAEHQALIVGITSANLTRSGWWENVEAFHFEEMLDKDMSNARWPYRQDLLSLLLQIRRSAPEDETHEALDRIRDFVVTRTRTDEFTNVSARGTYYTRIWCGQEPLAEWVAARVRGDAWHLDVISPFFDSADARAIEALIEATEVASCRVFLPEDLEGRAQVTKALYDGVAERAAWGRLPTEVVARKGSQRTLGLLPRGVHAKVYRFFTRDGHEAVLVGSPNLTSAAHGPWRQGNLESAFFVDTGQGKPLSSWLEPIDPARPVPLASEPAAEDGEAEAQPVAVSVRMDWARREVAYRLDGAIEGPLELADATGGEIAVVASPVAGAWQTLPSEAADRMAPLLLSTSFVVVRGAGKSWRVLVREEQMMHRPSLLQALTPEEILLYWSLLSPEQRAAFVAEKLEAEALLEGLPASGGSRRFAAGQSLFDRFAGLFHAFECLRRHVAEALEAGDEREAERRLLGAKHDSLPQLLVKVRDRATEDPVQAYLTFLCAKQVVGRLQGDHPEFFTERGEGVARLADLIAHLDALREALPLDEPAREQGFLAWYEEAFLLPVPVAEEEA